MTLPVTLIISIVSVRVRSVGSAISVILIVLVPVTLPLIEIVSAVPARKSTSIAIIPSPVKLPETVKLSPTSLSTKDIVPAILSSSAVTV